MVAGGGRAGGRVEGSPTMDEAKARGWPPWARRVATAGLLLHMAAVVSLALASPPSSPLERWVADRFLGYAGMIDQGQAHRYYVDPPPTPIVTARLRFGDGRPEREVRLPDPSARPRLLYQRQLALAYHLDQDFRAAQGDPHGPRDSAWARSYARHLCEANPGCEGVALYVQLHLAPPLEQIRDAASRPGGTPLDPEAPEFYTTPERIGDFPCDDF